MIEDELSIRAQMAPISAKQLWLLDCSKYFDRVLENSSGLILLAFYFLFYLFFTALHCCSVWAKLHSGPIAGLDSRVRCDLCQVMTMWVRSGSLDGKGKGCLVLHVGQK